MGCDVTVLPGRAACAAYVGVLPWLQQAAAHGLLSLAAAFIVLWQLLGGLVDQSRGGWPVRGWQVLWPGAAYLVRCCIIHMMHQSLLPPHVLSTGSCLFDARRAAGWNVLCLGWVVVTWVLFFVHSGTQREPPVGLPQVGAGYLWLSSSRCGFWAFWVALLYYWQPGSHDCPCCVPTLQWHQVSVPHNLQCNARLVPHTACDDVTVAPEASCVMFCRSMPYGVINAAATS